MITRSRLVPSTQEKLPGVKDLPPWGVSLLVHGVIVLLLLNMAAITVRPRETVVVDTMLTDIDQQAEFTQSLDLDVGDAGVLDSKVAAMPSSAPDIATQVTPERIEDKLPNPKLAAVMPLELPAAPDLAQAVDVKGTAGEYTNGGADGAIDRLTLEIKRSLQERKTLVIWVLDSSLSLAAERELIAPRFERIYRELGVLGEADGDALLTAIVGFGEKATIMTEEPTADFARLQSAVSSIEPDPNGKENVFAAIGTAAEKWAKYRTRGRRNVMIVAVTDGARR